MSCRYISPDTRTELKLATEAPDIANLPLSFRSLWVYADRIRVAVAEHSGGASLESIQEVQDVYPANELCRFLSLAPVCFHDFRLFAGGEQPKITVIADWELKDDSDYSTVYVHFDELRDLAAAMQQFARAHGLTVTLSSDETYLHVVRL